MARMQRRTRRAIEESGRLVGVDGAVPARDEGICTLWRALVGGVEKEEAGPEEPVALPRTGVERPASPWSEEVSS